jgi:hypothetical protein
MRLIQTSQAYFETKENNFDDCVTLLVFDQELVQGLSHGVYCTALSFGTDSSSIIEAHSAYLI